MRHLVMSLLTLAAASACSTSSDPGCACTEEFRFFTVTVLDDASQPVSNLEITRVLARTGQVLEPGWLGLLTPGTYLVADDGQTGIYRSAGDTVRVTGSLNGTSVFSVDYVFAVPEPCRCHVELRSGPDTVIWGDPGP